MMFQNGRCLGLLLTALLSAHCGGAGSESSCNGGSTGGGSIEGSYCEEVEMIFSEVRTRLVQSKDENNEDVPRSLEIDYRRPLGTGFETTLKISINLLFFELRDNVSVDLTETGTSVRRILEDGVIDLNGQIGDNSNVTLSKYSGELGSDTVGTFDILFTSGRTLRGDFSSKLVDARSSAAP
jgi:hypothetical protein